LYLRDPVLLLGQSEVVRNLQEEISRAAQSQAKVLILGETGVGKEVVARSIHIGGRRQERPFLAVNCSGIPESLLESELFGHVRGSFTGAYRDKPGLVRLADQGTLFLDELGEMSLRMQAVLLRFAETGEVSAVGSDNRTDRTDIRLITATNRDLRAQVAAEAFRKDLYYRLNVIEINIPPLRARREDVPHLFKHFLGGCADACGIAAPAIAPDTMKALVDFEWPGNVRQLKNVAERLIARGPQHPFITVADLPPEVVGSRRAVTAQPMATRPERLPIEAVFDRMVQDRESFWSAVYPAFMTRDLTRADLRFIVGRGLQETSGSYKMLVELLNMKPTDYKRFLNFLRKHECQVPFERYRSVRRQPHATAEDAFKAARNGDECCKSRVSRCSSQSAST
jgi:transcriptional regulator with PAS, ATPase and Fis domain